MRKKHNQFFFLASILIVAGIIFLSYDFIHSKKMIAYEYMGLQFSSSNKQTEEKKTEEITVTTDELPEEENPITGAIVPNYYYVGYLEIPKIDFKRGFVAKDSIDNDVEKNIMVIKESDVPSKEAGNFIIAAHSGTGYKAFFQRVHELALNDQASITYEGVRYTYQIADIYKQPKNGKVSIRRDKNKNTLTLITCTVGENDTQTVYIAYLIKKESL